MKLIPLTQGKFAKVDDSDYESLISRKWWAVKFSAYYYAATKINGKRVLMHRLLLNTPTGMLGDHRDGDTLNNQRGNLRNCSRMQNGANRRKKNNGTSKYLGVTLARTREKYTSKVTGETKIYEYTAWKAEIRHNKKGHTIGQFQNEEDAARAYNKKALELHGEFANLNKVNL